MLYVQNAAVSDGRFFYLHSNCTMKTLIDERYVMKKVKERIFD